MTEFQAFKSRGQTFPTPNQDVVIKHRVPAAMHVLHQNNDVIQREHFHKLFALYIAMFCHFEYTHTGTVE